METTPTNLISIDVIMSNYDHEIRLPDAEERLRTEPVYGEYTAWHFFGKVWFDNTDKKFKCMIKQYRNHIDTIEANTLEEIMEIASDKYGYE